MVYQPPWLQRHGAVTQDHHIHAPAPYAGKSDGDACYQALQQIVPRFQQAYELPKSIRHVQEKWDRFPLENATT